MTTDTPELAYLLLADRMAALGLSQHAIDAQWRQVTGNPAQLAEARRHADHIAGLVALAGAPSDHPIHAELRALRDAATEAQGLIGGLVSSGLSGMGVEVVQGKLAAALAMQPKSKYAYATSAEESK
jgi:hypothetical protein